jgi:hypothetical protein
MAHYLIITDATAAEVEATLDLRGHDTPLGVLVEKPEPFDMNAAMTVIDRTMNPTRCTCGRGAVIHSPNCPIAYAVT